MYNKLIDLNCNIAILNWLFDFLTNRSQFVKICDSECSASLPGCHIQVFKFVDDTTVVGLIKQNDGSFYHAQVQQLIEWCSSNDLVLNVDKTKEMYVDFRKVKNITSSLFISGTEFEVVDSHKILGVHF